MKASIKWLYTSLLVAAFLWISGCGNSNSTSTSGTKSTAQSAALTVNVGDAPSDSIVSLEAIVTSITLTNDKGDTVPVLSKPTEIELRHLAGSFEPVSFTAVPAGTYTQANVQVSSVEVTILDATGKPVEKSIPVPSSPVTVKFSSPLTISAQAATVNLEFNLESSITIDSSGNINFSPVVTATVSTVSGDSQHEDDSESGEVDGLVGTVSGVSAPSFTITVAHMSNPVTINTDSSTKFEDISGLSALMTGMIVEVEAVTRSDGSLLATKVEARDQDRQGMEVEGLVVTTTGTPVTQFGIVVDDRSEEASAPNLGSTFNVTVDSTTQFQVDQNGVDLTGLGFTPAFDANSLTKGQSVEADAGASGTTNAAAKSVRLKQQGFTGTVSGLSQTGTTSTFTLTVPKDSVFATLTGQSTITVFQQGSTQIHTTVSNGAVVQVRGLLFFSGGNYNLVARRINNH